MALLDRGWVEWKVVDVVDFVKLLFLLGCSHALVSLILVLFPLKFLEQATVLFQEFALRLVILTYDRGD